MTGLADGTMPSVTFREAMCVSSTAVSHVTLPIMHLHSQVSSIQPKQVQRGPLPPFFFFFKCWQENIADFGRWSWICFFFQAPIFVFCFDVLCLQLSNEQDVCSNCVCLQKILWSINKQGYFFILLINYFKQILLTYCIWWCILSSAFDAWYFSAKYSTLLNVHLSRYEYVDLNQIPNKFKA